MGEMVSLCGRKGFPFALSDKDSLIEIHPSEDWIVPSPRSVTGGNEDIRDTVFSSVTSARVVGPAAVYIAILHDALVSPSGVVFTAQGDLVYESLFPWQYENYLSQFQKDIYTEGVAISPKPASEAADHVDQIFLAREGGEVGYFHFINSIIPRIGIYNRIKKAKQIPILVNARQKFASELLSLMKVHHSLPWDRWYRVDTLFFPSPMTVEGDHFFRPPFGTQLIREAVRDILPNREATRRIYLSRSDSSIRKLNNEDDVLSIIREFDFEEYVVSDASVTEQIEVFSGVKYLISPHGAGLSNMVFMSPEASVLELLSPQRIWPTYRLLAARLKMDYHALVGDGFDENQTSDLGVGNENFTISPRSLRQSLSQLLLT